MSLEYARSPSINSFFTFNFISSAKSRERLFTCQNRNVCCYVHNTERRRIVLSVTSARTWLPPNVFFVSPSARRTGKSAEKPIQREVCLLYRRGFKVECSPRGLWVFSCPKTTREANTLEADFRDKRSEHFRHKSHSYPLNIQSQTEQKEARCLLRGYTT
jgi:hypothetical protein